MCHFWPLSQILDIYFRQFRNPGQDASGKNCRYGNPTATDESDNEPQIEQASVMQITM